MAFRKKQNAIIPLEEESRMGCRELEGVLEKSFK